MDAYDPLLHANVLCAVKLALTIKERGKNVVAWIVAQSPGEPGPQKTPSVQVDSLSDRIQIDGLSDGVERVILVQMDVALHCRGDVDDHDKSFLISMRRHPGGQPRLGGRSYRK